MDRIWHDDWSGIWGGSVDRPDEVARRRRRVVAKAMWAGFYRCPTTNRIIEAMSGDDKVLCRCGQSNPAVPTEYTALTGTHIIRFLREATVDQYLDQQDADEASRTTA